MIVEIVERRETMFMDQARWQVAAANRDYFGELVGEEFFEIFKLGDVVPKWLGAYWIADKESGSALVRLEPLREDELIGDYLSHFWILESADRMLPNQRMESRSMEAM